MDFDPEAVREFEREGWNRAARAYETSFATATRQFIQALLDAAGVGRGRWCSMSPAGPASSPRRRPIAAMIAAQSEAAMPAIVAHIAAAERYRDGDALAVPIAAVVASGVRA